MSHKPLLTRRCLFSLPLAAATGSLLARPVLDAAAALKEASFDAAVCWRVRDLAIIREDLKIYLTDGYVALAKPIGGAPIAAMFWADVEGGDAEIILLPPSAGERQSLARFCGSPNLNVHFKSAMFLFTDATGMEIAGWAGENAAKPAPEIGALLAGQFDSTLRNVAASFETRLTQDIAGGVNPEYGLFFAAIGGTPVGAFDVIYDPQATDQIVVAQLQFRENRPYYNTWTSFPSRRVRKDPGLAPELTDFKIESVTIQATFDSSLRLSAVTTLTIRTQDAGAVRKYRNCLAFDLSQRVRVRRVTVDGEPADVLRRENLRSNLLRGNDNEVFLVGLTKHLAAGSHTVQFEHDGEVVIPAGNGVYYVGARGTWYPHHGVQFATYDITFRCPSPLTVVATGELIDERQEGDVRITRRRAATPIRIAGFNLGEYKKSIVARQDYRVEVYANKMVEASLAAQRRETVMPAPRPIGRTRSATPYPPVLIPPPPPDPSIHIEQLAAEIAETYAYLTTWLGPAPLKTLAVSPIPGAFGQGFPGLIYLSTLSYLNPKDRPSFANEGMLGVFFNDILIPHEVAHQWWGNTVTTASYRDEWVMEALANYSALMLLERKRGIKALDQVLESYREHLLSRLPNGGSIDSAGPIRLGSRLESSETPGAYRALIYEKGTWIIHMLRRRLGEKGFFNYLREIPKRFERRPITTRELQELAAAHQPEKTPDRGLDFLFAAYVEGIGIPSLRLTTKSRRSGRGFSLEAEIEQTNVPSTFSVDVPIEIDLGSGRLQTQWIRTDGERTQAEWTLSAAPVKVALDPRNSLLAVKH
jgi:hypothetical protein